VIPSLLVYSGAALAALAGLGVVPMPLGFFGALVTLVALAWPTAPCSARSESTLLDRFLPGWQFNERHGTTIDAPPDAVWRAIREVTAGEIRFFLVLTWLRSPHLPGRAAESILNPDPGRPILDTALRTGFVLLGEEDRREVVLGAALEGGRFRAGLEPPTFRDLAQPGLAKTAMNFCVTTERLGRVRLTTETRVSATDARSRRLFAVYWRLILPGSALIRRNWLAAIQRRSERPA
jgi:hypothetical protein